MNLDNFVVRPRRRLVEKYAAEGAWTVLSPEAVAELAQDIAGLPAELDPEAEEAKRFDLLILNLELALLRKEPAFARTRDQVKTIAGLLEEQSSIPMVREQMPLIQDLQTDGPEGIFTSAQVTELVATLARIRATAEASSRR